jgi:hypothetical protein
MTRIIALLEGLKWVLALFLTAWFVVGWITYSLPCDLATYPQTAGKTCEVLKVAYDWANLIAGIFAIVAALVGGHFILRQISHADQLAAEQRKREEKAAKAVLPLALADLSQYARDCIRFLDDTIGPRATGPRLTANLEPPRLPENSVHPLQECAKFADPENRDMIAKALGKLQIQNSRLRGWAEENRGGPLLEPVRRDGRGHMWDAADLHAAVYDLFEYARDVVLVRQVSSVRDITTALRNSDIWDDAHPIWQLVEERGQ